MIDEITEEQAYKLAEGAKEWPIIIKEENEITESAVTLKKFPTGYVLGVSCDTENIFKLYYSENLDEIMEYTNQFLLKLSNNVNPLS